VSWRKPYDIGWAYLAASILVNNENGMNVARSETRAHVGKGERLLSRHFGRLGNHSEKSIFTRVCHAVEPGLGTRIMGSEIDG